MHNVPMMSIFINRTFYCLVEIEGECVSSAKKRRFSTLEDENNSVGKVLQ